MGYESKDITDRALAWSGKIRYNREEMKTRQVKKAIVMVLAVTVLTGCGGRQPDSSGRLQQSAGQFSFVTPAGWAREKLGGMDFVIVSTHPDAGAKPNIFVDFVETPGELANVVKTVVDQNKDSHQSYKIAHQSDFVTDSGLAGVKISAGRENSRALPLATFHYVIKDVDRVIVITCTCADSVKQKYEPIFDSAMNSLRTERDTG